MPRSVSARLAGPMVALALLLSGGQAGSPERELTPDVWQGYRRLRRVVAGREAFVVVPRAPLAGAPWIWRATFWAVYPEVDRALLSAGFHVGYIDTEDMYGSPSALEAWDVFYAVAVGSFGLSARPVLEGISRGGLYVFRWAAAHPDQVAAIYADVPVCDFKSWPAGKGTGGGSPADWIGLRNAYGFRSEEEALRFSGNPIDQLEPLARAKIPLLHVYGETDDIVPPAENTLLVASRYRALGGRIVLLPRPGGHFHGPLDPQPIVAFLLAATR